MVHMAKNENTKSKIAEREEEILKFWRENKIFEKSLEKPAPKGEFVFYEGPPTANGKPGIHHLEARAFKDVIPRYKTMQGFYVRRKGGWDTHGLPVELQVEKGLGLKTKKDIEEYGVANFNKKCKESVWEYLNVWKKFTDRIGFWIDQEDPYITYENYYIEAVWNILKKVEEKKLLYKDYKVVPWCPRCETGLSSHELAQGYEDVKENSVTVKFRILGQEKTYLLAWTTTPWTLPGNIALAVGENIDYVKIKIGEELLILAKTRLSIIKDKYEIVEEIKGKNLIGLKYEPLFHYAEKFASESEKEKLKKNAFKIYPANFVTTEDGTGVVHTAVMYGQEDFELGNEIGLPKIHLVNPDGAFKEGMDFLSGRFVKEKDEKDKPTLDIEILNYLKKNNFYFSDEPYSHSYPFCWRCHTPLIYYARDSWYIKMSDLREKLVKENESINWVPAYIKEGRFGEWLREVKDWAISRERYWGTPLPIWQNDGGENYAIGSIEELKKYTKKSGNKYFIMRHGEAENNIKHILSSKKENSHHLTEKGIVESKKAAEKLKKEKIDIIISSPFIRTKETAEIAAEILDLDKKDIQHDDRLVERDYGDFNLEPQQKRLNFFSSFAEAFDKPLPGGENYNDIRKRMGNFIYELDKKYSGKNILIISHQGPLWLLSANVQGLDMEGCMKIRDRDEDFMENSEWRELDFTPLPHNENYELDLHKPFIDEIELVDERGNKLTRVKEVVDVWLDSGAMPFAQDGLEPKEKIKYPADFISEAIDQTRGWFYTLHAIGILMGKGKSFKNVICLGHVLDAKGKKMSKSLGNIIDPWIMIEKYGVDALRMWMYTVNQPGDSKNFDEKTVDEVVKKVFNLAGNTLLFYELYRDKNLKPRDKSGHILDRWIIARINNLIGNGTLALNDFNIFESARAIRDFINDFSTWYIRRSRDRFKSDDVNDKNNALATTHFVLLELAKYMAPFTPFFAEYIYLKLKSENDPESVHLCDWFTPSKVEGPDEEILKNMQEVRKIVSLALEKRMAAGIKVRQPLRKLSISNFQFSKKEEYLNLIKDEVNIKEIIFDENLEGEVKLDTEITEELQKEGNVREFIRAVQELRKQKNLAPADAAELLVETDDMGKEFLESVSEEIKKATNISNFMFKENDGEELKMKIINKLKIKIK